MRAVVIHRYGGPEALQVEFVPEPRPPGPQEVRIGVKAMSVNPIDWKQASGAYRPIIGFASFPAIPGYDVAGEVLAVGAGLTGVSVGDRVHVRLPGRGGGGYAEQVIAHVDDFARMPSNMDWGAAAGIPLAGMTALQGLRDHIGLTRGGPRMRILVVGASGGVGHLGVQIARAWGAEVVGVCSTRNKERVRGLGCEVIDYTQPNPYKGQAPFDGILDCTGQAPGSLTPLLAPGGTLANCTPGPATILRGLLNPVSSKQVKAVMLKPNAVDLRILDDLYAAGELAVWIDGRYAFPEIKKAWERSISGRAVGKILVEP